MKVSTKQIYGETNLMLGEIFCNTILETEEGNHLSICMRDDTIEMSVPGSDKWYRVNMQTGDIDEM